MKLPKYVVALGEKCAVRLKKNLELDGEEKDGVYDPELRVIWIDKNMLDHRKLETLKHEIIHFICDVSGLSQIVSEDAEEIICETFAKFIVIPIDKEHNIDFN